jgi:hypothetical protein
VIRPQQRGPLNTNRKPVRYRALAVTVDVLHPEQVKGKAVPQHTHGGAGGRGGIAPTHSRPRH